MIVSLEDAKKKLGIEGNEKDTEVTALIESLTAEIYSVTGRSFGAIQTVTNETHDYAPRLYLDNMDITEVTKVTRGYDNPIEYTTGFHFDSTGQVVLSGASGHRSSTNDFNDVRVDYKHGVEAANVPADLKLAALDLLNSYWKTQTGEVVTTQRTTSISIGTYRETFAESSDIKAMTSINNFDAVIKKYTWKLKA